MLRELGRRARDPRPSLPSAHDRRLQQRFRLVAILCSARHPSRMDSTEPRVSEDEPLEADICLGPAVYAELATFPADDRSAPAAAGRGDDLLSGLWLGGPVQVVRAVAHSVGAEVQSASVR